VENKRVTFFDCLGLLFIALKLTGAIEWSWWAVLAPLYVPAAASFCVGLVVGFINGLRKRRGLI